MFINFIRTWKEKRAAEAILNDPLHKVAMHVFRETMEDPNIDLKSLSQELKEKLADDMVQVVDAVRLAENPVLKNRKFLVNAIIAWAKYQVLVLTPEGTDDPTGLRGKIGITGELKAHIKEISEKDKEIKKLVWNLNNPTVEDIFDLCQTQYWIYSLQLNVINVLRVHLGDFHKTTEKDWFRPFGEKMCALAEHDYREEIGMPTVLTDDNDRSGAMVCLLYNKFTALILNGSNSPLYEWEEFIEKMNKDDT